jgi:uncharacterized protein involved in exopolysaccharide biosynthesis
MEVFIRRFRVWATIPVVAGALAVVVSLLLTPQFRSYASFAPDILGRGTGSGIGELFGEQAAALGFAVGGRIGADAQFYVELVRSREIREQVALRTYATSDGEFRGSLVEFFGWDHLQPPPKASEKTVRELDDRTNVTRSFASGTVTLTVTTRHAEISKQIAEEYLAALDRFNREKRSGRGKMQVEYLNLQVEAAEQTLRVLEDSAQLFLEQNRAYQNSPALAFHKARLDRQIGIRVGILTRLRSQLEQAQLELLRETPTVSVIDAPRTPQERVSPRRKAIVVGTSLVALVIGIMIALTVEGVSRSYGRLSLPTQERIRRARERLWILGRKHASSGTG